MSAIESKRRELEALCERHRVERLALFGSASRDDFDPESSDLDFSVEFSPMTPKNTPLRASGFWRISKGYSEGVWISWRSKPSAILICEGA